MTSAAASLDAASPCIGVCRLDPSTGLCLGCRRNIAEIAAWPSLSPEARRAVLAQLPEREGAPQAPVPSVEIAGQKR